MSNPAGVDSNAQLYCRCVFESENPSAFELKTQISLNNTTSATIICNCWIVIDGNETDTLPVDFPPGLTRREFTSYVIDLTAAPHTVDFYIGAISAGLQYNYAFMFARVTKA